MITSYNKKTISEGKAGFTLGIPELWNGSHNLSGLDWNYCVAPFIDRDLHEKLLNVIQKEMAPIITTVTMILSLIRSGYFYTASLLVQQLDVSSSATLTEIKAWLLKTLIEADDTEEDK